MDLVAAAGTVAVDVVDDDVVAVGDAVGDENRAHAAADDAGDAVVVVVLGGGLAVVCDVDVDDVGDAAAG